MRKRYQIGGDVEDDEADDYGPVGSGRGALSVDPQTAMALSVAEMFNRTTTPEAQKYSRSILDDLLANQNAPAASAAIDAMKAQAAQVREALKVARERLEAQPDFDRAEALLAIGKGLGSPTRTGAIGETAGNVAGEMLPIRQARTRFNRERDSALSELDLAEAGVDTQVNQAELGLQQLRERLQNNLQRDALDNLGRRTSSLSSALGSVIPESAKALDQEYVKTYYLPYVTGGAERAAAGLNRLRFVQDVLERGSDALTGPYIGAVANIPWVGRWAQGFVSPTSADLRDLVERTIQEDLRPTLGSQFTATEGENLIARSYNTALEEPRNARRIKQLIEQMEAANKNQADMAEWYNQNQTLYGFPRVKFGYTANDFQFEDADDVDGGGGRGGEDDVRFEDLPRAEQDTFLNIWQEENPGQPIPEEFFQALKPYARGGRVMYQEGGRVIMPGEETEDAPSGEMSAWDKLVQGFDLLGASPDMLIGMGGGLGIERVLANLQRNLQGVPEQRAEAAMVRAGLDPVAVAKDIKKGRRMGVPQTLMDVDAPGMHVLTEEGFRYGEGDAGRALRELRERVEGSRERVNERINKTLKPYEYFDLENKLVNRITGEGRENMKAVFDQYPGLEIDPVISAVLETPEGERALKDAMRFYENVPGRKPGKMTLEGMIAKPSLEFYDYMRKAFDQRIAREERAGEVTEYSEVLRDLRKAFVDRLDAMAPDYQKARIEVGSDLDVRDALRSGRNFMKLQPEQLESLAKSFNFHQKNAYLTGVAQSLYETLDKSSAENFAAAQRVVGSPATMARIQPFLKPDEFELFRDALKREADLLRTSKRNLGLGESAMYEREKGRMSPMEWLQKKAPGFRFAIAPMGMALRYMRDRPRLSPDEGARVLSLLRQGRPEEMDKFIRRAQSLARLRSRRGARGAAAAGLGAAAGAGAYALRNSDQE